MKRILKAVFIIWAIYWMAPSSQFSGIVEAADPAYHESAGKAAMSAHGHMTETYLNTALEFASGLEQQVKADVSLTDPDVKEHLQLYTKGIDENLKQAQVHLSHIINNMSRRPASMMNKGESDPMMKADQRISRAVNQSSILSQQLSDNTFLGNKDRVKDVVSQLRSQIKDAISSQKDLNSKLGV